MNELFFFAFALHFSFFFLSVFSFLFSSQNFLFYITTLRSFDLGNLFCLHVLYFAFPGHVHIVFFLRAAIKCQMQAASLMQMVTHNGSFYLNDDRQCCAFNCNSLALLEMSLDDVQLNLMLGLKNITNLTQFHDNLSQHGAKRTSSCAFCCETRNRLTLRCLKTLIDHYTTIIKDFPEP